MHKKTVDSERNLLIESVDNYNSTETVQSNNERIYLTWENISAHVDVKALAPSSPGFSGTLKKHLGLNYMQTKKQLLYNLSGYAIPGNILAILGSSGAGSAMLRMKSTISDSDRYTRVQEVIATLDLERCQNTIIGIPGKLKGISGGELKRLTFASVILNDPQLLIIDEPTSGLDSHLAKSIVYTIKKLALSGKTIITVIHQPTSEIYSLIDSICLLVGGKQAYFGVRDSAIDMFSSLGRQCPNNYNPAEYYLTQLASATSSNGNSKQDNSEFIVKCVETFQQSTYNQLLMETITDIKQISYNELSFAVKYNEFISSESQKESELDYESNFFRQMKWLLWRAFKSGARDPVRTTNLLSKLVIVAIIYGLLYFQITKTQEGVQNMNALSLNIINSAIRACTLVVVLTIPLDCRQVFRDYRRRLYSVHAYYICKVITDLPYFIIMSWVFVTIVYFMTHMRNYFLLSAVIIILTISGTAFASVVAALSSTVETALLYVLPSQQVFLHVSGFFINNASIPSYVLWLQFISIYYYGYSLVLILQWANVSHIKCDSSGPCFRNGTQILRYNDIPPHHFTFYLY
ncbi:unnamed protein product, partial [Didymodactylos carnosus]